MRAPRHGKQLSACYQPGRPTQLLKSASAASGCQAVAVAGRLIVCREFAFCACREYCNCTRASVSVAHRLPSRLSIVEPLDFFPAIFPCLDLLPVNVLRPQEHAAAAVAAAGSRGDWRAWTLRTLCRHLCRLHGRLRRPWIRGGPQLPLHSGVRDECTAVSPREKGAATRLAAPRERAAPSPAAPSEFCRLLALLASPALNFPITSFLPVA